MKSMTGMGKASGTVLGTPVRVELRSVNHRFCEVNFRAHGKFMALEIPVTKLVRDNVARGRLDLNIFEEKSPEVSGNDKEAFVAYKKYLENIKAALGLTESITLDHILAGVNSWVSREIDPKKAWADFEPILQTALDDLNDMRFIEGEKLKNFVRERFDVVSHLHEQILDASETVTAEIEQKLKLKLNERLEELARVDSQRLEAEVIFYADRADITEELERIESHMKLVTELLAAEESVGRKLDFILQEFNREFNTIASKSQKTSIAHWVVDAKTELEKIREQVQNIE